MIDTHCHIDDEQYRNDLDTFILTQQQDGVEHMIVPGINRDSIRTVGEVCDRFPQYLSPALGLHPEEVKADFADQLEDIHRALLAHPERYVAIGEIGLDYYWDTTFREEQKLVFRTQCRWAIEMNLPVIIHNREATADILSVLREFNTPAHHPLRGVFHCWTGSEEIARELLNMGFYLGIGGTLTFKNCRLREHMGGIPLDRILLETDSPYMAPVPHRGERNESRWMRFVAEELARIYDCPSAEIIQRTSQNAKQLFQLK